MHRTARAAVHAIAESQHGCFAMSQAAERDISRRTVAAMLAAGEIIRGHRGVYRMASAPVTWRARLMAAVLAAGSGAVASHAWAAWLHGMDRVWLPTEPEVTVPAKRTVVLPGVTVHRSRDLSSCDRTTEANIPATSPARTNVDLAARLPVTQRMALTDDLICRRKTTRSWQYERACALAPGRPGANVIVDITKPGAEGEFWSWLERRFHVGVVEGFGLPVPRYNVPLYDDEGRIGFADACWDLSRSVVVELDGLRFHELSAARRADTRKANRYALSGRLPLRFTYRDVVDHPEDVAATIRTAVQRAGALSEAVCREAHRYRA